MRKTSSLKFKNNGFLKFENNLKENLKKFVTNFQKFKLKSEKNNKFKLKITVFNSESFKHFVIRNKIPRILKDIRIEKAHKNIH